MNVPKDRFGEMRNPNAISGESVSELWREEKISVPVFEDEIARPSSRFWREAVLIRRNSASAACGEYCPNGLMRYWLRGVFPLSVALVPTRGFVLSIAAEMFSPLVDSIIPSDIALRWWLSL